MLNIERILQLSDPQKNQKSLFLPLGINQLVQRIYKGWCVTLILPIIKQFIRRAWFNFSVTGIVFVLAASAGASTYLDLSDASYELFSRLEAAGVVRSGLLTTRPLSRNEAVRLLHEAE